MFKAIICGRVGLAEPTKDGKSIRCSIAIEKKENETQWVSAFIPKTLKSATHINKGALVSITGDLGLGVYKDKPNACVYADSVVILIFGKKAENATENATEQKNDDAPF